MRRSYIIDWGVRDITLAFSTTVRLAITEVISRYCVKRRELRLRQTETEVIYFPIPSIHGFPSGLGTSESFPSRFRATLNLRRRPSCFLRIRQVRRRCSSPQTVFRNHHPPSLVLRLRNPRHFPRWRKHCRKTCYELGSDHGWVQTPTVYAGSWDSVTVLQPQCTPIVN